MFIIFALRWNRPVDTQEHRRKLIRLLRLAYSGEKAAAYAYAGHWRSVKDENERATIRKIELEEIEHRRVVGEILERLGEKPQWWREIMMAVIGRAAGAGCFFTGWFFPMYFAGKLEHANVKEYDGAAYHALHLGLDEFLPKLHQMSLTEQEHERFFGNAVMGHPWLPFVRTCFGWDPGPILAIKPEGESAQT